MKEIKTLIKKDLIVGNVYYLKDFTAPKVFNGLYFECLLTDQKISANESVKEDLGSIKDWKLEIYKPERFFKTEAQ